MATTPVFLPGEFHGQRNLAGYSPRGRKELDMTERLTLSLSSLSQGTRYHVLQLRVHMPQLKKIPCAARRIKIRSLALQSGPGIAK